MSDLASLEQKALAELNACKDEAELRDMLYTVVDAETNQVVAKLPSAAGHTLAADPWNNHIFAPVTGVGIKVFAAQ